MPKGSSCPCLIFIFFGVSFSLSAQPCPHLINICFAILTQLFNSSNQSWSLIVFIAVHLSLLFSILELIVWAFSKLTSFNKKIYKKFLNSQSGQANNYRLNERYQQLENVYTGKQLAPSFFLHFINILCSNILVTVTNYYVIPVEFFIDTICFFLLIHAFCKLFIEVTVIT
ncbi:unnamed protein product [Meloidogyne enterolobii]|uniref:Uncharacterized protein n=1 Tax=Meloidogyne enterolobii TaxID=390850 RepID=A0ACB0XS52_MELEN